MGPIKWVRTPTICGRDLTCCLSTDIISLYLDTRYFGLFLFDKKLSHTNNKKLYHQHTQENSTGPQSQSLNHQSIPPNSHKTDPHLFRASIIAPFGRKEESHHFNFNVRQGSEDSYRETHTRSKAATKEQPKTKRYPAHPHQP